MKNCTFQSVLALVFCASFHSAALAHFPWLVVNSEGKAALFFGENVADRTYKLPDSLLEAKLFAESADEPRELSLGHLQTEDFVGMVSKERVPRGVKLTTDVTYGIYHGNRLNYYVSHIHGALPVSVGDSSDTEFMSVMSAEIVGTASGIDVFASRLGKPLVGVDVHLYCKDGHEEAKAVTNQQGKVSFSNDQLEDGLNGIMFGYTDEDDSGKLGDQEYQSSMHYCTMTFIASEKEATLPSVSRTSTEKFDDLPFEITSFGAVRVGDTAWVYGGHTGNAHSYSTEEQSDKLLALDLSDPSAKWKVVSSGIRLQGLAMVSHGTRLVLIGGFTAKNSPGEEHDLHSRTSVRAFDTATQKWSDLPDLPSGRSSHDAAIIGDCIFVVGGWTMAGEADTEWHQSALCLDLSKEVPSWEEIAAPPFQRRALATVAHRDRLYVIGGMDKEQGPTRSVEVYDPQSNTWMVGPELPGEGRMAGFGAAGWSVDEQLVVSTYEGAVVRLVADGNSWQTVRKSEDSRFFHRLVPLDNRRVLAVGGANMEAGKFLNLEILDVQPE